MKSIKPGRGPSAMGVAGSIVATLFGVFWTIMAFSITRDSPFSFVNIFFPLFGVLFVGIGIFQTVYHYKNATGKERMSLYDITDSQEEGDPLNRLHNQSARPHSFCPYCGTAVQKEFVFCPGCGKNRSIS